MVAARWRNSCCADLTCVAGGLGPTRCDSRDSVSWHLVGFWWLLHGPRVDLVQLAHPEVDRVWPLCKSMRKPRTEATDAAEVLAVSRLHLAPTPRGSLRCWADSPTRRGCLHDFSPAALARHLSSSFRPLFGTAACLLTSLPPQPPSSSLLRKACCRCRVL